jgi:poly(3-hydroxybutyrate) depolymerase
MNRNWLFVCIFLCAATLVAQGPRVNPERAPETPDQAIAANTARYDYRPDVMILSQMVQSLKPAVKLTDEDKALVDKLMQDARGLLSDGNSADARRRFSHAIAILLGRAWNEQEEFNASLVLRTDNTVADTAQPFVGQLAQRFSMRYKAIHGLRLKVTLAQGGTPDRPDVVVASGKEVQELGIFDLPARDLVDNPYRFTADLRKVPEGSYLVVAEVLDGDSMIGHLVTPLYLVVNFQQRHVAVDARIAKIPGHDSVKATIDYPWDLALGIDTGNREINALDFGAAVKRSEDLTKALESGKDRLYRALGDNKRNYYFTEAGEIMPYRICVPSTWTPASRMPMILALHGSQLDENNFITRNDGMMCKLGEKYGYIVAAPLGFRINGGYGWGMPTNGPVAASSPRDGELSEKDAMNVMELVASEYNVDRSRIYIMGNSMGGMGTFLLGAKYREKFTAMVPCGAGIASTDYPFERIKGMPLMMVIGDQDGGLQRVLDTATALKDHGIDVDLEVIKGGSHKTAVEMAMPQIYEFFNSHQKKVGQ